MPPAPKKLVFEIPIMIGRSKLFKNKRKKKFDKVNNIRSLLIENSTTEESSDVKFRKNRNGIHQFCIIERVTKHRIQRNLER